MKKYSVYLIIYAFISIMFITVSYSAFNTNLYVSGRGILRAKADIRVVGIVNTGYHGDAIENYNPNYNVDITNMSVDLPESSDYVTYDVTIRNKGNKVYIAKIELLSSVNENVVITMSDGIDTFNIPNDDLSFWVNSNENKTFALKISNKPETANNNIIISLKYYFVYDNVTVPIIDLSDDNERIELLSPGTSTFGVDHYEYYISETDTSINENTIATGNINGSLNLSNISYGSYYVWYRTVSTKGTKSAWSNKVTVQKIVELTYISNGGSSCQKTTAIKGKTWGNLCKSTNGDYLLSGWYTDNNTFKNKIISTTIAQSNLTVYAKWETGVALIGDTKYATLQAAVTAAPQNIETTIKLIADTSESVSISNNKNIILDLQDYIISNNGDKPVIENAGTLSISNGTFSSNASKNAVINNTGTVNISGGNIIATGDRQALYNNGGTVNISGTAYLSSTTDQRATVHNLNNGILKIEGGTIISNGFYGVTNPITNGRLVIGTYDGTVNKNSPLIQGVPYGINSSSNFEFHDGIVKGTVRPFNNINYVTILEDDYEIINSSEIINGSVYNNSHLAIPVIITYNANGGNVTPASVKAEKNVPLASLAQPTRGGHTFDGWFTADGTEITAPYSPSTDIELIAHWTKIKVAKIGTTQYDYIQDAINAVGSTSTTIKIIANTTENIIISSNKNITLDLQGNTLGNDGNSSVIENNGTLLIKNGTITSNADTGAINNNNTGNLTIDYGARIVAIGTRQAIYNLGGGYVEIKEGSYLSSVTSGKPTNSDLKRATVQNLAGGTVVITGGEIINTVQQAISNEGLIIIGEDNSTISTTSPSIIGKTHAIHNIGTLEFYDGILKGLSDPVNGDINKQPENSNIQTGTEIIDESTYQTLYLD